MIDKMVKQLCMDVPESSLRSRACARTDLMVRLVDKMVKQSCMDVPESSTRRQAKAATWLRLAIGSMPFPTH